MTAEFRSKLYRLVEGDKFELIDRDYCANEAELEELSNDLATFVEDKLKLDLGFLVVPLLIAPDYKDLDQENLNAELRNEAATSILASPNWTAAKKILVIICNYSGAQIGIWSRSLCMDKGLRVGTVLPYVEKAFADGYAVLILRPNTNSVYIDVDSNATVNDPNISEQFANATNISTPDNTSGGPGIAAAPVVSKVKVLIKGSESPESHVISVWENVLPQALNCEHLALLGYGNGASLCHSLYLKSILSHDMNIISSFVTVEASQIIQEDDSVDIRTDLGNLAINFEHSLHFPMGAELHYRKAKLGVTTISVGIPEENKKTMNYNVGVSASLAMNGIFSYLQQSHEAWLNDNKAEADVDRKEQTAVESFKKDFAMRCGLIGDSRCIFDAPLESNINVQNEDSKIAIVPPISPAPTKRKNSIFGFLFGNKDVDEDIAIQKRKSLPNAKDILAAHANKHNTNKLEMTVDDFDLLKVVGKGAFGKVLLVRKKEGQHAGRFYAMKILRKTNVIAGSQVEHAIAERSILLEVKQPFIAHLRYAFQNQDKLYLLTDYYNGGSLFMHLCNAKQFTEERTSFYAAEILSAIDYLHKKNIIYRDLKLENIMMDYRGHLALIDFGLSKHHFDESGATTFCGTAYYIAPEVLNGYKYGYAVDYWSFGVLVYEMLRGRTPFQDQNKKLTFQRILKAKPAYNTEYFSPEAIRLVSGLLTLDVNTRLGSNPELGAREVMCLPFFKKIDWDKLRLKEIQPPFVPDLSGPADTKFVGKMYERMDPTRESLIGSEVMQAAEKKAAKYGKTLETVVFPQFSFSGNDSFDSKASAYGRKP